MFDDNAARRALHTLTDEPAPPVSTTLDEVLRRGRRRVFVQRMSGVAGVMAVVAAIGVGAVLLRPSGPSGGVEVGGTNSATTTTTTPSIQSSEPQLPVAWEQVDMPPDMDPSPNGCMQKAQGEHGEPPASVLPKSVVEPALKQAITQALTMIPASVADNGWNATSGRLIVEVPTDDGNGQLQLETRPFGGTPLDVADAAIMAEGNCVAPHRRVLRDGTVLQLYAPNEHTPEQPTQTVRIFRPDGRMYILVSAGYSEADMVPVSGSSAREIVGGRGKTPTTAAELAELAERFDANLP